VVKTEVRLGLIIFIEVLVTYLIHSF